MAQLDFQLAFGLVVQTSSMEQLTAKAMYDQDERLRRFVYAVRAAMRAVEPAPNPQLEAAGLWVTVCLWAQAAPCVNPMCGNHEQHNAAPPMRNALDELLKTLPVRTDEPPPRHAEGCPQRPQDAQTPQEGPADDDSAI